VKNYQYAYSQHGIADWLINLDSDDYYTDKDWINVAMQILAANEKDNICHIQSNFLSRIGKQHLLKLKSYRDGYYLISGFDYVKLCIKHYGFSHLSSIFKIELLEKLGAYSDDCLHTDFLTAARAAIQGNVLIGSKEIGVWRKHDGNQSDQRYSSAEFVKNQVAYYRFFEWCEDFLSYKSIQKLIRTFENRELDRKLITSMQSRDFNSLYYLIREEGFNLFKIIRLFLRLLFINSRYRDRSDIGHGIFTRALSLISTLFTLPFLLSYIGVVDYSWIGIFTTIVSAMYLFDFGLTSLITKEISQEVSGSKERLKTVIASQEIVYWSIGIGMFLILYSISDWIMTHWFYDNLNALNSNSTFILVILAILVQWPHSFYTGALFGLDRQMISNYSQLIITLVKNVGVLILFQILPPSIELFFYWHIAISFITILVQKILIYQKIQYGNSLAYFSWKYVFQLRELAFGISLIGIFGFIYSDVNNFLLMRWLSKGDFGYYAILFNIITAYIMYCATVKSALFPSITKTIKLKVLTTIQSQYTSHFAIIGYTLVPLSVYLLVFRRAFLELWLQDTYIAAYLTPSFVWIILGSLANALMIIPWTYLIAQAKTKLLIILTGFMALVSIPLLYFLVRTYVIEGAAIYWFCVNLLPLPFLIYRLNTAFKIQQWNLWRNIILIPLTASLLIFYTAKLGFEAIQLPVVWEFSLATFALFLCYGILFLYRFTSPSHKF